jgi:hypothetical protein
MDNVLQLTPLQLKAAAAMLQGMNLESAATAAGCSSMSIDRWLRVPAFRQLISDGKSSAFLFAANKLARGSYRAVEVLEEIMESDETPSGVRVKCATEILSHAIRLNELTDLNDRIQKIEVTLNANQ